MCKLVSVCLVTSMLFAMVGHASLVEPDDGPYLRLRRPRLLIIYDESSRDAISPIESYMQTIRDNYDTSFDWKLDSEADLILTSPAQQVDNAFASIVPNVISVWYPGGAAGLETAAESSWGLSLALHETSHLYQLNAKVPFTTDLAEVFGSTMTLVPFLWPISLHPNLYTPTFLIEGNAVFNESRANLGGRLHSGEVRALVLAQIAAHQVQPTRLINDEFRFPYNNNAYYQGGYFQAHLAGKYGVDKTNQFFKAQADHWLLPLILNKTFRDHFGASYAQEIHEYVREWMPMAVQQKSSSGRLIVDRPFIGALNHDANRVFFLASDGLEPPRLIEIDKAKAQVIHDESHDLPLGKVFWKNQEPYSSASVQHDWHHFEASLYGEDHDFQPEFRGQLVNDQRQGHTVAMGASHAWLDPQILVDGEIFDIGHSQPILDDAGHVYYFRQTGPLRVLYKDRQPVFKYEGFYGKLMEVDPDGSIYFIANTALGSSLYAYKNGEIVRQVASDRVVDARRLNHHQFLTVEIHPDGEQVRVTESEESAMAPAVYNYAFANYDLKPSPAVDPEQIKIDERPYSATREMRYSGFDLITTASSRTGVGALGQLNFNDPLEYQNISASFLASQYRDQAESIHYSFTRYLVQPFAQYTYDKEFWSQANGAERTAYEQQALIGATIPLWLWHHWNSTLLWSGVYERLDNHQDPSIGPVSGTPVKQTYGSYENFTLDWTEKSDPPVEFYPWRSLVLNVQNRIDTGNESWRKADNTSLIQVKYQRGFPFQFYATLSANTAWSETHNIWVDYNPMPLTVDIRIPRLTATTSYEVTRATSARFELAKVLNTPLYSARIPLGIDRIAPLVAAQGIFMDDQGQGSNGGYPANIFEWGYGADVQILMAHLWPVQLRFIEGFDTRNPNAAQTQATLNAHFSF